MKIRDGRRATPGGQAWSPSLLDRLLEEDPPSTGGGEETRPGDVSRQKHSVARDLEVLLNTRRPPEELLEAYPLAAKSMLGFGIMDLSTISIHDARGLRVLQDHLRQVIEHYEPRLGDVRIHIDTLRDGARHLRFRVDATLRLHPSRPSVAFDATLQLGSNTYLVRDT